MSLRNVIVLLIGLSPWNAGSQILITQETQKFLIKQGQENKELKTEVRKLVHEIRFVQKKNDSLVTEAITWKKKHKKLYEFTEIVVKENKRLKEENQVIRSRFAKQEQIIKNQRANFRELQQKDYKKQKKYSYTGWLQRRGLYNTILATSIMGAGYGIVAFANPWGLIILSAGAVAVLMIIIIKK